MNKGAHTMIRKTVTMILTLVALTVGIMIVEMPSHTAATVTVQPTPSATPTLPRCIEEDGAGMAECAWYSRYLGHDIVSGDCSLDITGTEDAREVCINLHAQPSETYLTGDGDSMNTIPNGADLVQECNDEIAQGVSDPRFSLIECYKAWL